MYLHRDITPELLALSKQYPVITLTGPRQSGKTTLAKKVFTDLPYFNAEDPDIRAFITDDPRKFLNENISGAIIDEAQRVPQIFSYLQGHVDQHGKKVKFILTGSNQFSLLKDITQTLAGRTALLTLLPLSLQELSQLQKFFSTDELMVNGFYPGIYEWERQAGKAYRNYFETYVERDLRHFLNVKDLGLFRKFVMLCAGRIGQLFNANAISNELGVSVPTIQSWISVLEASYILFLLPPWHANIGKRLAKTPKLYFNDVGLAASLLGIETPAQMARDPLRGMLFENMVITEVLKFQLNKGNRPAMYFYRDSNANEVDLILEKGRDLFALEIKSSQTYNSSFIKGLSHFEKILQNRVKYSAVIYDGEDMSLSKTRAIVNFRNIERVLGMAY